MQGHVLYDERRGLKVFTGFSRLMSGTGGRYEIFRLDFYDLLLGGYYRIGGPCLCQDSKPKQKRLIANGISNF
jgi:hypothetical protein